MFESKVKVGTMFKITPEFIKTYIQRYDDGRWDIDEIAEYLSTKVYEVTNITTSPDGESIVYFYAEGFGGIANMKDFCKYTQYVGNGSSEWTILAHLDVLYDENGLWISDSYTHADFKWIRTDVSNFAKRIKEDLGQDIDHIKVAYKMKENVIEINMVVNFMGCIEISTSATHEILFETPMDIDTNYKEDILTSLITGGFNALYDRAYGYFTSNGNKKKKKWSEWKSINLSGFSNLKNGMVRYRTNGRVVEVEATLKSGGEVHTARSKATCHPQDTFDEQVGLKMAVERAYKKILMNLLASKGYSTEESKGIIEEKKKVIQKKKENSCETDKPIQAKDKLSKKNWEFNGTMNTNHTKSTDHNK